MLKVAINGFGRIGRMVLRAIYENQYKGIKVLAINNRAKPDVSSFLLSNDTVHGKFNFNVRNDEDSIFIGKDKIDCYHESDPLSCPWEDLGIDVVFECTGKFNEKEKSYRHIEAGAKKVIVSAPCKEADQTIVYGINQKSVSKNDKIISIASCTTNCLAPLAYVIHKNFKIEKGYMTTIHSYTTDQRLLDNSHKDLRRARSAPNAMVPTSTGAAKSLKLIIPDLKDKVDGISVRVPTPNVSLVQFSFNTKKKINANSVNQALTKASNSYLKGILGIENKPLVSSDFNHDPRSSIIDTQLTKIIGDNLGTVFAWYDNEWGFSNRMIDLALFLKNKL
jgi:glyceraldehyde 3-phosphate dehydrogenase